MENLVLAVTLIGVLGIGAQWLAWRLNLPAIVLMAIAGILAGPVFGLFSALLANNDRDYVWRVLPPYHRHCCCGDFV